MNAADRCNAAGLDPCESKLLAMVALGRRNECIAKEMSTTERRVASELAALERKLGVQGRVGLAQWYFGDLGAPVRTVLCFGGEEHELR